MSNSSIPLSDKNSSPLLTLSVNISMTVVVLAFLCHLTAVFILLRPAMRHKTMSPFMINICIISLVLAACGYSVTIGTNLKRKTDNNTRVVFACSWVAYVDLLCSCAYSSTLCAMNVVSKVVMGRCSRGAAEPISRKSKVIVLSVLWIYPFVISTIPLFPGNLYRLSASELMCQLHWPSKESLHNFYNTFSSIAMFLLPMVICCTMQYLFSRIWKRFRETENVVFRRRLAYRSKINKMVLALTVFFFVSQLPYHVANVVAMVMGYYTCSPKTAFVLEIFAQSNVLCPPFVLLFLNSRYRLALKELLTGSAGQRIPDNNQRGGNFQGAGIPTARSQRRREQQKKVKFCNRVQPLPHSAEVPAGASSTNTHADSNFQLSAVKPQPK